MRKFYLIFLSVISTGSFSQCGDYSQLLLAGFKHINFFDPDHGIAFGQGTMIRTDDGGMSWEFVQLPTTTLTAEKLHTCSILDENTAMIGGAVTLLRTEDKGLTWNPVSLPIKGLEMNNSIDFVNAQTGYILSYVNNGLLTEKFLHKTVDGGLSWSLVNANFVSDIVQQDGYTINFIDETTGFAWAGPHLIKTTDGGETWYEIIDPTGNPSSGSNPVSIKQSESGFLVLAMRNGDMPAEFYLSDTGETWMQMDDLSTFDVFTSAYAVKDDKLYTIAYTEVGQRALIVYDLAQQSFSNYSAIDSYMGEQSDIHVTDDGSIYIIDKGHAFFSNTPGRKIIKSVDGGASWVELDSFSYLAVSSNHLQLKQNSPGIYTLLETDNQEPYTFNIYTSADDGVTWQKKLDMPALAATILLAEDNYIKILVDTAEDFSHYQMYESFDYGETWNPTTLVDALNGAFLIEQIGDLLSLGTGFDQITLSFNDGETWIEIPLPDTAGIEYYRTAIINENELYAWGINNNNDYYLYRSGNLGETWNEVVFIADTSSSLGFATTEFGNDFAFVSTGGNHYYMVNLIENSFEEIPFDNPLDDMDYIPHGHLKFLTDDKWLIYYDGYLGTSDDFGQNWDERYCFICGPEILFDVSTSKIITYNADAGIERFEDYIPTTPVIIGDTSVSLNDIERYYITFDAFGYAEWMLQSGGTIIEEQSFAPDSIEIQWLSEGQHVLKARYVNECGESEYYEIVITVGNLEVIDNKYQVAVTPNPFSDLINIELQNLHSEKSVVTILSLTGQVIYKETVEGKLFSIKPPSLSDGVYFLVLENGNKKSTQKIIKY